MRKFALLLVLSLFLSAGSHAQQHSDTTTKENIYYTDLSDLLHLRIYSLVKLNNLKISLEDKYMQLEPNGVISLGVGFNFKGLGLGLGIGIPSSSKSNEKYGKTRRIDVQLSILSKRVGGDAYFQAYKGYYCSNPNDIVEWNESYYPQLPDMQTISLGVSVFYIFNHGKYSHKAAVSRTQVQHKSAGSITAGLFVTYDDVSTENGFKPSEFPDSIGANFDLKAYRYIATGINLGYTYTWVISKSFFLNLAAIPGLGYKNVQLTNSSGELQKDNAAHAQLSLRGALGYDSRKVYAGFTASSLIRNMKYKEYNADLSTENFRLFVGMRFNLAKK